MIGTSSIGVAPIGVASPSAAGGEVPPVVTGQRIGWFEFDAFAVTVDGITIDPPSVTLADGESRQFSSTVFGTGDFDPAVTWSTSIGSIDAAGRLTLPSTTAVRTVFVTATSVYNPTKSATATVTQLAPVVVDPEIPPVPAVLDVIVSPASAAVDGGGSQQFSATVIGTNNPPQDVTWEATLGSIDANGLLVAPASTPEAQIGSVTATSTFDPDYSGTASFIVPAKIVIPDNPVETRAVNIVLGEAHGPAANLTGVMVSVHAATGPHDSDVALFQSEVESTDENGMLSFTFVSTLDAGDIVLLSVLMPDGRHYLGLVAVE